MKLLIIFFNLGECDGKEWKKELADIIQREYHTDSDIEDLAYKYTKNYHDSEIWHEYYRLCVAGTPCEGCKHAYDSPEEYCVYCSRAVTLHDFYEREEITKLKYQN